LARIDQGEAACCLLVSADGFNHDHRHGGIRYRSRAQRHASQDVAILVARHEVYLKACERKPARW